MVLPHLIGLITNVALFGQFETAVPSFARLRPIPRIVFTWASGRRSISARLSG